jgi:hypothetical protein
LIREDIASRQNLALAKAELAAGICRLQLAMRARKRSHEANGRRARVESEGERDAVEPPAHVGLDSVHWFFGSFLVSALSNLDADVEVVVFAFAGDPSWDGACPGRPKTGRMSCAHARDRASFAVRSSLGGKPIALVMGFQSRSDMRRPSADSVPQRRSWTAYLAGSAAPLIA